MPDMMSDEEFFATLPPGYRFQPTDQLLLSYLVSKIKNEPVPRIKIHEAEVYDNSPEDLVAGFEKTIRVDEWYFFTRTKGTWVEKGAKDGVWKTVGGGEAIEHRGQEIGNKKLAVFAETDWQICEFRLKNTRLDDWVLCKLFKKS